MADVMRLHRARRMGTQLIKVCVQSPGLAMYKVHPSPTPDGRYGSGIPMFYWLRS